MAHAKGEGLVEALVELTVYWYYGVIGPVGFVAILFLYFLIRAPYRILREENAKLQERLHDTGTTNPLVEWVGVRELCECNGALVEYLSVPTSKEIAASNKLRPHLKRALRVLDQQDISYPDFDTNAMVINDTLKWSNFLSTLLACCDDLERAQEAARDFCETHD